MSAEPLDPGLAGLNPPQREAVLHQGGPLVVFAGAGSGKTRVITMRVARLVADLGVEPYHVLAVTFTNKAAQEMRERLARLIGGAARDLWVGTFHATCARLLRRYAKEIGVRRDFTIYDEQDSRAMVKRVIRDLKIDDKRYDPKIVAGRIARAKQEVQGPDEIEIAGPFEQAIRQIYAQYEERMQAAGALDFADLLYRLVVAVEKDAALRTELGRKFRHLLVDEFQDTNQVQYRLVRAIGAQHRQVVIVGDDDQSIYRWRGADRRNLLLFRQEFPDAAIIKLEQNYRSTQRILRAANAVITRAKDREPKALWTENEEGPKVQVLTCADERREAVILVEAVRQLRSAGRTLDEMAVFYRVHAQSRLFEEELRRHDVPYKVVGGMRFYDRAEIKDLLAYLRVLANPDDDVSLLRIINTPTRGIGKKTIEDLLDAAARSGAGLWAALERAAAGSASSAKRLADFVLLIRQLRQKLTDGDPLAAVGYAAYTDSGYKKMLSDEDTPEADARMQNVEELLGAIQSAEEADEELTLAGFLEQITLDTTVEEEGSRDRLSLMTVHAAKGLEFPVVLVAGLEENTFPFKRGEEYLDPEALDEERRLAYVAMTRARERLMLSWAVNRRLFRESASMQPSRFLLELPADDIGEIVDPETRGQRLHGRAGGRSPSPFGGGGGYAPARSASGPPFSSPRRAPAPPPLHPGDSYVDTSEGDDAASMRVAVGMRVQHGKFGVGRVVEVKPTIPPRVDVKFHDGVRTIRLDFLEPA